MKYLINLIKLIIVIIISTLIFGTLSYFNIISDKISSIFIIVLSLVSIFYLSYNMGIKKEKNGYIEGIIFGMIIFIFFLLINIIFRKSITKMKIIYYFIIILISTCGSILGINKKTKV